MQKKIDENIKVEILNIILKNLPNFSGEIFLFGSFAQGKATNRSDIDLCLKSSDKIDFDILTTIKAELTDSNIPYKIDIIDYGRVDSDFRDIAFKEIEKWYPN